MQVQKNDGKGFALEKEKKKKKKKKKKKEDINHYWLKEKLLEYDYQR